MSTLEFIASIVDSLAWPIAVYAGVLAVAKAYEASTVARAFRARHEEKSR